MKAGYTQDEIAVMCEKSNKTISQYYSGKCKPSIDVVIKLADAFGVTTDFVLGRSEGTIAENTKKRWQRKKAACSSSSLTT